MDKIRKIGTQWLDINQIGTAELPMEGRRTNPLDGLWVAMVGIPGMREWRAAREALFAVTSFGLGLFWFITIVVIGALGAGLTVTGIGFPILAALLALVIFGAQQERGRLRIFLGMDIPSPYRFMPREGAPWRRAWSLVRNPQIWRDGLYLIALFPLGIIGLVIVVTPIQMVLALPLQALFGTSGGILGFEVHSVAVAALVSVLGIILIVPISAVLNLLMVVQMRVATALLAGNEEERLIERVEVLTESRSAVMRAMHLERRRIERDLHDGAQQRLVSLAMELGLAREKLETDPEGARLLLEESHNDAKLVLSELRDLVRGIHPAVLTDRGLDAAISAIAGRSPIPVSVRVHLTERQPEEVEGTAYFVIVEALTNIAKHSQATRASVSIDRRAGWLRLQVTDDGIGGADPYSGSGLRGLQDRIEALDGRLSIDSPTGGGTTMVAEIPCR